jgi:hypothetical protein
VAVQRTKPQPSAPIATPIRTPGKTPSRRKPPGTPSAAAVRRKWATDRDHLTKALVAELNEHVFGGRLPSELAIVCA